MGYITSCTNEFISSTTNNQILQSGYYDDFTFDFGWTVTVKYQPQAMVYGKEVILKELIIMGLILIQIMM